MRESDTQFFFIIWGGVRDKNVAVICGMLVTMEDWKCVRIEKDKIVHVLVGTDVPVSGRLQYRCSNSHGSY